MISISKSVLIHLLSQIALKKSQLLTLRVRLYWRILLVSRKPFKLGFVGVYIIPVSPIVKTYNFRLFIMEINFKLIIVNKLIDSVLGRV